MSKDKYRWNHVEDKIYPCNETRTQFITRLSKIKDLDVNSFLTKENELLLWHLLYSIKDKKELGKALATFARKHQVGDEFAQIFKKFPPYDNAYGAYSAKAIKKLLPFMRRGNHWNEKEVTNLLDKVNHDIKQKVIDEENINGEIHDFQGLHASSAGYIVYGRFSEDQEVIKWNSPADVRNYLSRGFKQHSLRNPIVEQVVTETLRLVSDIWEYYGNGEKDFFDEIHIELGREMKNSAEKRKFLTQQVTENENTNLRIRALLRELKDNGNGTVRPFSPSQHQINASEPLKKQLWQQTIKAKIGNQAALLGKADIETENMYYWQKQVRSGDPDNLEGRSSLMASHNMTITERKREKTFFSPDP